MIEFENIVQDIKLLKTPFCGSWAGVVLVKGEQNILIDSGANSETVDDCIVPALKAEGLTPDDLDIILCTHSHGDHVGGHNRLRQISKAKIAAFGEYVDKIRDPLKYNKLIRAPFPEYSPPPSASLKGVEPDILLKENDIVAGRLRMIHTPGHDTDCVTWFDEKTKTAISGDSLQANGTELQGTGLYIDVEMYRSSVQKLLDTGVENVIAGHDYLPLGSVALGKDKAQWYLESCLNLIDSYQILIDEFRRRGETRLPDIAVDLIKHIGGRIPQFLFLPLFTVSAHCRAADEKR